MDIKSKAGGIIEKDSMHRYKLFARLNDTTFIATFKGQLLLDYYTEDVTSTMEFSKYKGGKLLNGTTKEYRAIKKFYGAEELGS